MNSTIALALIVLASLISYAHGYNVARDRGEQKLAEQDQRFRTDLLRIHNAFYLTEINQTWTQCMRARNSGGDVVSIEVSDVGCERPVWRTVFQVVR